MAQYPCEFDVPHAGNQWLEYYSPHRVYHPGWDLNKGVGNADEGKPVKCPVKGEVVYTSPAPGVLNGQNGGFGYFVIVYHKEYNVWSRFAHLKDYEVVLGPINEGDLIGHVGKTGTTSAHLHWEVWKPSMYMIQEAHWRKFAYYPTGKDKKFVMENYIDGLAWIDGLNAKPEYKKDLEKWAGLYLSDVPLLVSGDIHSMIALTRAAVNSPKK